LGFDKNQATLSEFFHQFFEVCLRFDLYQATIFIAESHRRTSELQLRNRRINFLKPAGIEAQHQALAEPCDSNGGPNHDPRRTAPCRSLVAVA
jgi:hypothetical protein